MLDENISRRIVPALQDRFPGSSQVALPGLERASDAQLCDFAVDQGFVLCGKDDDFQPLVTSRGYRPKLIRLATGNATIDRVLVALLAAADRIEQAFEQDWLETRTFDPAPAHWSTLVTDRSGRLPVS